MDDPDVLYRTRTLVARAQEHDEQALAELFDLHRETLRRALRRRLGDAWRRELLDSEDAVQDGILAALRDLDRFEYGGEGSFLAWLLRVAERRVLERLRAARAQKRDAARARPLDTARDLESPEATPSEFATAHETEVRLARCLELLPEREREVIFLRRYLDLSHEDIRFELGLPSNGAARALLSRAQAKLAVLLDAESAR